MPTSWQGFGKVLARPWQGFGKALARFWQGPGKVSARLFFWQGFGKVLVSWGLILLSRIFLPVPHSRPRFVRTNKRTSDRTNYPMMAAYVNKSNLSTSSSTLYTNTAAARLATGYRNLRQLPTVITREELKGGKSRRVHRLWLRGSTQLPN